MSTRGLQPYTKTHTHTHTIYIYKSNSNPSFINTKIKNKKKSNPSLITNLVRSWQSIISIVYGWWIHILELFHFMSVIYFHIFRLVDIRNNKIITLPSKKKIITLLWNPYLKLTPFTYSLCTNQTPMWLYWYMLLLKAAGCVTYLRWFSSKF